MTFVDILLLAVSLAIDASCVCTTNGLVYRPNTLGALRIALPFAIFQGIMPLIGYLGIGLLPDELFQYNHIVAFVLLCAIGAKMLVDALKAQNSGASCEQKKPQNSLTVKVMLVQAISTSIDALSVGVTLGGQSISFALVSAALISLITLFMCFGAVLLGKKIGSKFNSKAEIIGGIVLILLGIRLLLGGIY